MQCSVPLGQRSSVYLPEQQLEKLGKLKKTYEKQTKNNGVLRFLALSVFFLGFPC